MTLDGPSQPRRAKTILLVDDDDNVREVTRTILEGSGYAVVEAASGREALRVACAHRGKIDLLLTDVMMPGMNGPDLADSFLSLRANARVLFISGYAADALDAYAPSSRSRRVLLKPFSSDQLTRHVRAALAGGKTAQ